MAITKRTLKNYYTVAKNLRIFLLKNKRYKSITDINSIAFMRDFNLWLYHKFGKYHTKRHLTTIKAFIIRLVNDELLPYSKVRDYTPVLPVEEKKIVSLKVSDLEKIEGLELLSDRLRKIKDLFLAQCYTGLAYADLMQLNKNMLQEHDAKYYLVGTRTKSRIDFAIPLHHKAMKLLSAYNFSFDTISNQKYNVYLKELAELAKLDIKLTTHVGRRTCGQLYLNLGYSIEAVSRILGHSDIKTTQMYYAKSSFELVHNETLKMAS